MAVQVLSKSMDSTNLTSEKLEFATVTRDDKGKVCFKVLAKEQVDDLMKSIEIPADE